jgi:hypothetical protein
MQASKLKNDCARMLRAGHLNKHYLEIYGLIDMPELLNLLKNGKPFKYVASLISILRIASNGKLNFRGRKHSSSKKECAGE